MKKSNTRNTEIVVRHYGLLNPLDWDNDCEDELKKMDVFWNNLVNIHEKYVNLYYAEIMKDDILREFKTEFERLTIEEASAMSIALAKKKMAVRQKEISRLMAPDLQALELARRAEVKNARQNSGVWWGNYNFIVRAFESARSAALRRGSSVRRRTEGGSGRLTNTLQGGAAVEHLFDGSLSQIFIRHPQDKAWSAESRGTRRRLQRTTLTATIFVRSGERRNVTWPMIMHRSIPLDALVKNVVVTRRKIGERWKWAVSFTCTRTIDGEIPPSTSNKLVAVDVGWRRVSDGLRVATVLPSNGEPRFIILPHEILNSFAFINELRARIQESAQHGIDLLQKLNSDNYGAPYSDLLKAFQSREERKYHYLLEFCRGKFFREQPIDAIDSQIIRWRREYLRSTNWLINQQRKVVARRNHYYQNSIIDIVSDVSELIVSDIQLSKLVDQGHQDLTSEFFPRRAHYYRIVAAPSRFMRIMEAQSAKRRIMLHKIEVKHPVPCQRCGSTVRKSRADALTQVCGTCDAEFDIDVAACQNLLASANKISK